MNDTGKRADAGRPKKQGGARTIDTLCVAVLAVVVLAVFFRFAPWIMRERVINLSLYAAGRAQGCGLSECISPLDQDLRHEILQLVGSIREAEVTPDGLSRWETPRGDLWAPAGNNVPFGLAEQQLDLYQQNGVEVRPGDVVLDCGANIGAFTRLALDAGASLVAAIEPSPRNVECLRRNFAVEIRQGRVIVVPKGVWDEPGFLKLLVYDNSMLDSLVMKNRMETSAQASEVQVELVRIDDLVTELRLSRIDFVKMDIEGAERNALKGAVGTLRRFRPRLAIATENLADDIDVVPQAVHEAVPAYTQSNGRCRRILPTVFRPEIIYFQADRSGIEAPLARRF
jgi:FkbM family methyltransferase